MTDGLHAAHEQIGRLVDADPSINGTSTTATVPLFDGHRVGIGHVGDSRAYLFRDGELSQLTTDHTFVQSLIDEGRITEEEARVHPHRNLILKALDGVHEAEPDLFVLELVAGDRLFLCSDGACGVLEDGRLADILSMGTPDFAAVELVRASLEAGSSDNVTCIVADVVDQDGRGRGPVVRRPRAAPRRRRRRAQAPAAARGLFRGHRSGDTGELEPIDAEILVEAPFAIPSDPIDPETARYAPLPPDALRVAAPRAGAGDRGRRALDRRDRGLVVGAASVLRRREGRRRGHLPRRGLLAARPRPLRARRRSPTDSTRPTTSPDARRATSSRRAASPPTTSSDARDRGPPRRQLPTPPTSDGRPRDRTPTETRRRADG